VRHTKGGLLSVVLADGKPLPAGAVVRLEGQLREFPVGERGEVFVTGLGAMNRVKAEWGDLRCEFDLPFAAANDDPLPHLGTGVCKGAAR
jgi:outer membrane usher protein